jgi:hypothetical protein
MIRWLDTGRLTLYTKALDTKDRPPLSRPLPCTFLHIVKTSVARHRKVRIASFEGAPSEGMLHEYR